jgi:hypothetical protein
MQRSSPDTHPHRLTKLPGGGCQQYLTLWQPATATATAATAVAATAATAATASAIIAAALAAAAAVPPCATLASAALPAAAVCGYTISSVMECLTASYTTTTRTATATAATTAAAATGGLLVTGSPLLHLHRYGLQMGLEGSTEGPDVHYHIFQIGIY